MILAILRLRPVDFVKCRSDEDLQNFSRNSHARGENSGHDFNDYKDLARSDTGPQNSQRPPRRLSHRRSRSMGGELDEWQESEGREEGFLTLLNAGEGPLSEDTSVNKQKQEKREEPTSTSRAQSSLLATGSTQMFTLLKCRVNSNANIKLNIDHGFWALIGIMSKLISVFPYLTFAKKMFFYFMGQVMGAHFEKTGSKSFAVYTIKVTDTGHRSWRVQRRYS
jgi:sorting nexin-13